MRTPITRPNLLGLLTACVLVTASAYPAPAQSESELRQEGARQAQQLADLQAEVAALRARIEDMEKIIKELRAAETARNQTPSSGAPSPSETTTKPANNPTQTTKPTEGAQEQPLQSPATLLSALRAGFNTVLLKDPSFALGVNSPDKRAQKEAESVLSSWVARMNRTYKKPISWPVKILDEQIQNDGDVVYTLQVLSPDGNPAGKPFLQAAPARIARRVTSWREQPDLAQLILKGLLEPKLTNIPKGQDERPINTEVAFDDGQVNVNKWVRFDFGVRILSIMPIFVEPAPDKQPVEQPGGP